MTDDPQVCHCISIDVEGFVESNRESFSIGREYLDESKETREIEANIDATLALFDRHNIKTTFFILGRIAHELPQVVRQIANAGHEIGSHSYFHNRVYRQSREQFRDDAVRSKAVLEDISGSRVFGFRAPDFSIREDSLWAVEMLLESGFVYDSSLVPTDIHDVYGIGDLPRTIHKLPQGLWEFPIATFSFLGKRIPYGGGGYFRLFPVSLTRRLLAAAQKEGTSAMLYLHPYELGPSIPKINGLSAYRRLRHYYNCGSGARRLPNLLKGFAFDRAISILGARTEMKING